MKKIETNLTKKQEQLLEDFICYKEISDCRFAKISDKSDL